MKRTVGILVVLIGMAAPALAQPPGWTFEFAAGGAAPTSDLSGRLTAGYAVTGGVGYQFTSWLNVMGEVGFAGMGVPDTILQDAQAPDGHGHLLSINVEPEFRFPLAKRFSGFVEGGAGWIRRNTALTEPSQQLVDFSDPFYGDYQSAIAQDIVLSSVTRNAFGGNVGGGVSLPLADTGANLFVDVRYYYGPTSPRVTAYIPVTFGIRYTTPR